MGLEILAAASLTQALATAATSVAVSFAVGAAENAINSAFGVGSNPSVGFSGQAGGAAANSAGLRVAVQGPLENQRGAYGRVTTAGVVNFLKSKTDGHLYQGYLLAAHETDGLEAVTVEGNEVTFGADFAAQSVPYYDETTPWLYASFRNGSDDQVVDPLLASDFSNLPGTFRNRGHTTLVTKAFYGATDQAHNEQWPQGFAPLARYRGKKVYDPRATGQTADNPESWTWSDTASLVIADLLRTETRLGGFGLTADQIHWPSVIASADLDEQRILRKDGSTEKRYSINGVYTTADRQIDVLQSMLTANRGRVVTANGQVKVLSGSVERPVWTLTQDQLAGPTRFQAAKPRRKLPNVIKAEFVAPDREYQPAIAPLLERDDLILLDRQRLEKSVRFPWTEGHARATRLAKAALVDARQQKTFEATYSPNVGTVALEAGDVVTVDHPDVSGGMANGQYIIERTGRIDNFRNIHLVMTGYSAETYAWDAATDEPDFDLASIDLAA